MKTKCVCTVLCTGTAALMAAQYSIDSFMITGGGGTIAGDSYSVSLTIGSTEVGKLSGQDFTLLSGFWHLIEEVPAPEEPRLNIAKTGPDTVVVSWPSSGTDWFLQQTASLDPANWTNTAATLADDGITKSVVITASTGVLFYRLTQ